MTCPTHTAELYVRSLTAKPGRGPDAETLDRLTALEHRGVVDAVDVQIWGREIDLSGRAVRTACGQSLLRRLEAIRQWADDNDRKLPGFETLRTESHPLTGADRETLQLPPVALVEYRDGAVVHVTPHATRSEVYTVTDRIDDLEDAAASEAAEPAEVETEEATDRFVGPAVGGTSD